MMERHQSLSKLFGKAIRPFEDIQCPSDLLTPMLKVRELLAIEQLKQEVMECCL